MKLKLFHQIAGILLLFLLGCTGENKVLTSNIDCLEFMSRHDLVWKEIPLPWNEGAFVGNGQVGM